VDICPDRYDPTNVCDFSCPVGEDPDGDEICTDVDNCSELYNPDQVDQDLDLIGDPCDSAPADYDPEDGAESTTDDATTINPEGDTYLETPDGAASGMVPEGAADPYATYSIVLLDDLSEFGDMRVQGIVEADVKVIMQYEFQIGGVDPYGFPIGMPATVTFTVDAINEDASRSYRNKTIAIYTHEDVQGEDDGFPGTEDTYQVIPNCLSGLTTGDGRCTDAWATDLNGDGSYDLLSVSAEVLAF